MEKHFTTTVYLIHQDNVLLHKHQKLGKWLPPGGHLEADETPVEAARREVKEETGLDLIFLTQENLKVDAYNAVSFPRPFLCLLENIPEKNNVPAHKHIDLIYVAKPVGNLENIPQEFVWLSYDQVLEIQEDIFPDTKEMVNLLLHKKIYQSLSPERVSEKTLSV